VNRINPADVNFFPNFHSLYLSVGPLFMLEDLFEREVRSFHKCKFIGVSGTFLRNQQLEANFLRLQGTTFRIFI
jgi:hypothetical protein